MDYRVSLEDVDDSYHEGVAFRDGETIVYNDKYRERVYRVALLERLEAIVAVLGQLVTEADKIRRAP